MSESFVPRPESDRPPAGDPLVVSQGLTYRDLQRIVFLVFGLLLIWRMAGPLTTLLLFFLTVFILAAVFNPLVVVLQRKGVPRLASALLIALGFLGLIAGLSAALLPALLAEVSQFIQRFPEKQATLLAYYRDMMERYPALKNAIPPAEDLARMLTPRVGDLLGQVGRYTLTAVGGVVSLFLMTVLVIFSLANPAPLLAGLLSATPERYRGRAESASRRILFQLKNWAFGSLILGVIIGIVTAVGLYGLGQITGHGFPYILLFSIIAGIGEMIPTIGPIISAVPPALVAFTIDPMLGVWVIVLFVLIQQLENNFVVPLVMGQTLDFHPVSIVFAVLVMGSLFGLFGAVLAMPVAAIVKVCWQEFYLIPRRTNTEAIHAIAEDIVENGATGQDTPHEARAAERGAAANATDIGEPAPEPAEPTPAKSG